MTDPKYNIDDTCYFLAVVHNQLELHIIKLIIFGILKRPDLGEKHVYLCKRENKGYAIPIISASEDQMLHAMMIPESQILKSHQDVIRVLPKYLSMLSIEPIFLTNTMDEEEEMSKHVIRGMEIALSNPDLGDIVNSAIEKGKAAKRRLDKEEDSDE